MSKFILVVLTSMTMTIMLLMRQTSCYKFHDHHSAKLRDFTAKVDRILAQSPSPPTVRPPPKIGGVFYLIGYGADPTGHNDSTDAIQKALNDASQQLSDDNTHEFMAGVKDLGGAVIDLQGGKYKISKPISFPPFCGDLLMKEGSLHAAEGFPADRFLVEVMSPDSQVLINKTADVGRLQGISAFYEDVRFKDLLFDSGYSGGGLLVVDAVRTRIQNCYFFNFTTQGMLIQGGHETLVQTCFLGQHPTVGMDENERYFSGTGIDLASNDNVITDTVIFSAQVGLMLRGQANIITGLHTYNKSWLLGGMGVVMKVDAAYNRLLNCFFDDNQVVLEDPYFIQITKSIFLGHASVVLKSVKGRATSLTIVNNYFVGFGGAPMIELQGEFTHIHDVLVEENQGDQSLTVKSTAAKMTVAGKGTKWVADFKGKLVFPNKIDHFQYSFSVKQPKLGIAGDDNNALWGGPRFPIHAATNVFGNVVVVESEDVVDAIVSVVVDQINPMGEETIFR